MNKLPWIDALRGLAILFVIAYHTGLHTEGLPYFLRLFTDQGRIGVQLFYLISAFTLFLSMNKRNKLEKTPLRNYFIRRFFRIAPLFYLVSIYCIFRYGLGPNFFIDDGNSITIPNIIAHLTFLNGWNPYWINSLVPAGWSIAIEMPFYLLVPILFNKVKNINFAITLTSIYFVFSKIISFILKKHPLIHDIPKWNAFLYYWLPNQLPYFLLGTILYFLIQNSIKNPRDSRTNHSRFIQLRNTIIPLLLMCLSLQIFCFVNKINTNIIEFVYGIGFAALAFWLSYNSFSILVNPFLCYLGTVSYSAYLIHIEVISFSQNILNNALSILKINLSPTLNFIILFMNVLVITLTLSSLTYKFIEIPGMAIGRNLLKKLESSG